VAVKMLEERGHRIELAKDGREALQALEREYFDVVLMDLHMPDMDGYEATLAIRQREKKLGGHVPIIAMTANAMAGDRKKCLDAGMDDYLTKPVRYRELIGAVEQVGKRGQDGSPRAVRGARTVREEDDSPGEIFDAKHFEKQNIDGDLMREMIDMFDEECGELLLQIEEAIERGDTEALHHRAHSLKGMLGNYSSRRTVKEAGKIDAVARSGDMGHAREELDVLRRTTKKLHVALLEYRDGLGRG
jgi:two-component system sensor histidine kinase/response regulator